MDCRSVRAARIARCRPIPMARIRQRLNKHLEQGQLLSRPDRALAAGALVVVHPAARDSGREKNGHDVRADHSQKHYAIREQHLTPSNHTTSVQWDGFRRT